MSPAHSPPIRLLLLGPGAWSVIMGNVVRSEDVGVAVSPARCKPSWEIFLTKLEKYVKKQRQSTTSDKFRKFTTAVRCLVEECKQLLWF